jgi:hypothetical protein
MIKSHLLYQRRAGTEFSDAETGTQKPAYHLSDINPETRGSAKSPRSDAITAKTLTEVCALRLDGGRTRARTWDPMIKSHLLYQLSYAPGSRPRKAFARGRRLAKRPPNVQQARPGFPGHLHGI